jgi:hypothetical protein
MIHLLSCPATSWTHASNRTMRCLYLLEFSSPRRFPNQRACDTDGTISSNTRLNAGNGWASTSESSSPVAVYSARLSRWRGSV